MNEYTDLAFVENQERAQTLLNAALQAHMTRGEVLAGALFLCAAIITEDREAVYNKRVQITVERIYELLDSNPDALVPVLMQLSRLLVRVEKGY